MCDNVEYLAQPSGRQSLFSMIKRRFVYQPLHNDFDEITTSEVGFVTPVESFTFNMNTFRKLKVILWKNWLFRKRQYIMTFLEILLPTLFSVLVMLLRNLGKDQFKVTYHSNFTVDFPEDVSDELDKLSKTLLYTPEYVNTQELLKNLDGMIQLRGVESEQIMEDLARNGSENGILGGITFVGIENGSIPNTLHYRIRLLDSANDWHTDILAPPITVPGPMKNFINYETFMALQHNIALRFMELSCNNFNASDIKITTQKFPYPPYYEDSGFSAVLQGILPFVIIISYIFISPTLIKYIVREKEVGVKELMKLMGLPGWLQWIGWFISSFIIMTLSAVIIIIFLCANIQDYAVLPYSSSGLILFILILYIISAICFCFFISCFFSKPTIATAVGVLAWILSYQIPGSLMTQNYNDISLAPKLLVALFPNMAMSWAIRFIVAFEGRRMGIQWSNLNEPSYQGDNLTMLYIIMMFIIDIVLYSVLTWYLDNVFPGVYGVGKQWNFLFKKDYWCKPEAIYTVESDDVPRNSLNFEKEPTGLDIAIAIKNLSKSYTKGKMAVDNLSLNMYEGQITALLGHNGAGKTTTMSILTGMFSPSSGTAIVNGYDIRTNIDFARENLGLCPQHNMLFSSLTVEEHLQFFGQLKIDSKKKLNTEVTTLMQKLQLYDKRNTLAMKLSGGMKRKLNLGIALIGNPKIVMLDEPTSGMDPEARRAIWELLQELRHNRCIILSTHFMEEADVLGDRIAIMASGQIECCGSPLFLKKRYGAGYHLNISKAENCNVNGIFNLVQEYVPGVVMESNNSAELSLILPSESADKFASMFKSFEDNTEKFGIMNFGICVTTMEEVFLKVGESLEENTSNGITSTTNSDSNLLRHSVTNENTIVARTTDFKLWLGQFFALLLKRWYYSKRRWSLLIAQILLPVLMIAIVLAINNRLDEIPNSIPALTMDISQYGDTTEIAYFQQNTSNYRKSYQSSFPKKATFKEIQEDPIQFLEDLGENHFIEYSNNYIVGANFSSENSSFVEINGLYNGLYFHTQPLTLNLLHNTLAKYYNNSDDISLIVENAPLETNKKDSMTIGDITRLIKSIMMGVFVPVGLSFLSSSFVIFPIHERATKSKHLQLMTGVGGAIFWGASFVWDFATHIICSLILMIIFTTVDNTGTFSGGEKSGIVFLLLMLYGWCSIPFTYLVSFMAKLPATGFTRLTMVNLLAGIILSITMVMFESVGTDSLQSIAKNLQWIFRFIPNYTVTVALMTMVQISAVSSMAFPFNLLKPDYFAWNKSGIGQEVFMLVLTGCFYFILLALIERGVFYTLWYKIKKSKYRSVTSTFNGNCINSIDDELGTHLDSDVFAEKKRVYDPAVINSDVLVVQDLRKVFSNFAAVDDLSFGVHGAECFGLLGINGAGKTTTFQMLTGDIVVTYGNAYINSSSVRSNRVEYLKQVGYCPQFDALIDYLTGREILTIFARLRGIVEFQIKPIVDQYILDFDLAEHADKITLHYSGGNKRKLSAALGFIGDPPIVFLDEPTTGVDPVARRKIWDILKAANNKGISVVLTSHSMEECEVLCSRVGIMVNGQFQCLGAIQHLKNKFSQGFTVLAKLKANVDQVEATNLQSQLQEFIEKTFPSAVLHDVHQGLVHYHIKDVNTKWTHLFESMEDAKTRFNLEDYSVSQATLEQVFLSFARKQRIVQQTEVI